MKHLQPIFCSFLAFDLLDIDNKVVLDFCENKLKYDQCEPNQSDVYNDEINGVLFPLKQSIEQNTKELLELLSFKTDTKFRIGKMWINLNNSDHIVNAHRHPNFLFSGVYYVKCEDSGELEFMNPISAHQYVIDAKRISNFNEYNSATMSVTPSVGKMVMFPSWLVHYVKLSKNNSDRISIGFDIELTD